MAIHSGDALFEQGEYSGTTLNRVARLTAAGHGGQVLVSAAAAALARDTLPPGAQLRNLGSHRLRDLLNPETIYQLAAPNLQADFAALRTLDSRPNNLPSQISSFLGRADELRTISDALKEHRLVTITGPGGIGKTRLGLQSAAEALTLYEDGSFLIRFADIQDPGLVTAATAATLGVKEESNRTLLESLTEHLRHKQILLLLDSSEHLIDAVAKTVLHLLESCAGLSVLLTSREPTHLTGERIVRLDPLPPSDAQELFVQRAQYRSNAPASSSDREAIAAICRMLEAIPLAIELAAARSQSLSPAELAAALRANAPIPASKDPSATPRQRTLAATIEWSFCLLDDDQRLAVLPLSIFEGGFTAAAGQAIAGNQSVDEPFAETLDSLVDKSLVNAVRSGDETRYRFLDPIRQFLGEKLRTAGSYDETAERHCVLFEALAQRWHGGAEEDRPAADQIEREAPNMRAALNWAWDRPDKERAARFLISMLAFWQLRGAIGEGRAWLARALGCDALTPASKAALLRRAATFATKQDDYDAARALASESLTIYRSLSDARGTAEALHALAVLEHYTGNVDAAFDLYGEALDGFRRCGYPHGVVVSATNRAAILSERGSLEEARTLFEESAALCRNHSRFDDLASVLNHYADLELEHGSAESAEQTLR